MWCLDLRQNITWVPHRRKWWVVFVDTPPGVKCYQETHTSSGPARTQMEICGLEGHGSWDRNSSCSHGTYILLAGEKQEIGNKYTNQNNSKWWWAQYRESRRGMWQRQEAHLKLSGQGGLFKEVTLRPRSVWEEPANPTQTRGRKSKRGTPHAKA